MKPYTTPILKINIEMDMNLIKQLEFIFKDEICSDSKSILLKKFTADNVKAMSEVDSTLEGFIFNLPLSEKETALFLQRGRLYIDTRILTFDGRVPETQICSLKVNPTLFNEVVTYE